MDISRPGIPGPINFAANTRQPAAQSVPSEEKPAETKTARTPATSSGSSAPAQKRWTFLFYINGNNFLSKQAPAQLRMLELVGGSDDNVNIVAQVARKKGSIDGLTGDWSGVRRYEVPETGKELDQKSMTAEIARELIPPYTRGIESTLKDDLVDADMGNPQTLSDFVKWGVQNYPAEHYCLVMLGPSQGMRGVMHDETTDHTISTAQLKKALDDAGKATGKQLDVLAFDASNATQVEMLYDLKDSVKYVVGSEGLVAGTGMATPSVMFELKKSNTDKTRTPEEVAQTFAMVAAMGISQGGFTPTVSAIDTSKVGAVRDALNDLGDALVKSGVDTKHLRDIVDNTQEVAMPGVTQAYAGVKDPYHFAQLVSRDKDINDASVKAAAKRVMDTVDDALVGEAHRGGTYRNAHGISVFMPDNYGFIRPDSFPIEHAFDHKFNYEDLSFAKGNSWPKLLAAIGQDDLGGRVGSKLLGEKGLDAVVGLSRQWTPTLDSLSRFASASGWWESFNILGNGRPGKFLFLSPNVAATVGVYGGVYDVIEGVKAGVQSRSADAIVMNGIDVVGGVAKSAACIALMHPGTVPLAYAAGLFGFLKPWLKDAYGYYVQYKQIRDSIALATPDASQQSAVMAAHVMLNKNNFWDK